MMTVGGVGSTLTTMEVVVWLPHESNAVTSASTLPQVPVRTGRPTETAWQSSTASTPARTALNAADRLECQTLATAGSIMTNGPKTSSSHSSTIFVGMSQSSSLPLQPP